MEKYKKRPVETGLLRDGGSLRSRGRSWRCVLVGRHDRLALGRELIYDNQGPNRNRYNRGPYEKVYPRHTIVFLHFITPFILCIWCDSIIR